MINNVVMRRVEVTGAYQPLSNSPLIVSAEIAAPPTNKGPVYFRGDLGDDILWPAGAYHFFKSIDLSRLFVKGGTGDTVTVIGGTWRD